MKNIILIGASDHCRYTIDIIEQENKYKIVGLLDKNLPAGEFYGGYEVLGYLDDIVEIMFQQGALGGLVAIGDNFTRKSIVADIIKKIPDFKFINAIHPSVIIGKEVTIGWGSVIMAGVIINNNCRIGNHTFLATKSSIDHDSSLGEFSSLSPGVTTGGRVLIGTCTAIGIGATILHYKNIGNFSVVGGNSLVTKDIGNNILAFGIPAKPIKERKPADRYL